MTAATAETRNDDGWLGLSGKVAVVTGAAGGIGRAVALSFARAGASVAVLDVNGDGARETATLIREGGVEALAEPSDTANVDQVAAAAARVRECLGSVDVLVNNAATLRPGRLADIPIPDWQRLLDVNLTGYLICAREFGPDMVARGAGAMVHISSITGQHPQPDSGAYSSSKAAVSMLSRQLGIELGPFGVRSNSVAPGLIRTPLTEATYLRTDIASARIEMVPLRRIGQPDDIADVVTWLASDRARYVTGQEILVDGGIGQSLLTQLPR